jgi:hypothetical protein
MAFIEGRFSDSPYIQTVWHGQSDENYAPVCPADPHWNLLFTWQGKQSRVAVEGPLSKAKAKFQAEPQEFLVIRFELGVFMPNLPVINLADGDFVLPDAVHQCFWLHGTSWEIPSYDNVEDFVAKLVKEEVLIADTLVNAALEGQESEYSERTLRRRFLKTTGLAPKTIQQIERAQLAMSLLEQKKSILDVAYETGYSDQAHLTRELKRFTGMTPAQLLSR